MDKRRSAKHDFRDFVLDQLRGLGDVTCRAMFGGFGLYCGGVFFAIIHNSQLFFKVSDATRPDYEAAGMKPFRPGPRQTLKTYYEVPADILENHDELTAWARRAVQAAGNARKL